jgi:uncharacterized protein YyaL (SSP411 family)
MLYDEGQLLRTYAEAWRRTRDDELLWPIQETAAYLRREMRAPDGGFYASQDADSEGEEGKFFVWRPEEIVAVLGPERGATFCAAYGVTPTGNFEHGTTHLNDVARRPRSELASERAELLAARARRVPPGTDTKRVSAWNALAISGLARAGSVLGDRTLLADAVAAADFVLARLRDDEGRLLRVFAEGSARIPAFLDDVAGMLEACLDLHRAGAGERFLRAALGFAQDVADRFYDDAEGDLFLTPTDGERLAVRPRSDHDGATPHSPGLAVLGLLRAAAISGDVALARVTERVLRSHAFVLERVPSSYPTLVRAAAIAERGLDVAVIVGPDGDPARAALAAGARTTLAPEAAVLCVTAGGAVPAGVDPAWLAGREPRDGRATAWLCRGVTCTLPLTDPDALVAAAHEGSRA